MADDDVDVQILELNDYQNNPAEQCAEKHRHNQKKAQSFQDGLVTEILELGKVIG
jgi:hypothetical protein